VSAASDLATFQNRLRNLLTRAKERKERAEAACRENDRRHTGNFLKQSLRKTTKVAQALRARRARKVLSSALREELLQAVDGVQGDLRLLRGSVRCPDDAE
jgi:hypothetical protein